MPNVISSVEAQLTTQYLFLFGLLIIETIVFWGAANKLKVAVTFVKALIVSAVALLASFILIAAFIAVIEPVSSALSNPVVFMALWLLIHWVTYMIFFHKASANRIRLLVLALITTAVSILISLLMQ